MNSSDDFYTINLPAVTKPAPPSPSPVRPESSRRMREHVERFARYFLREMHTDGTPFEAAESPSTPDYIPYAAYLFNDRHYFFGACCFRWREWLDAPASWSLDWLWLHPYFRSRGNLTQAWPALEASYGQNFHIARPLSPSMKAFLHKIGRGDA